MRRRAAILSMFVGVLLILGAAGLLIYNQWDSNRAATAATETAVELSAQIAKALPKDLDSEDDANKEMPVIVFDGNTYIGILSIPVLDLLLPVMETWDYDKLKISPCRYTGSYFNNDLVLMAHNYRHHFGNVSSLQQGDEVIFFDVNGVEYGYMIELVETLNSTDVDKMIESEYDLTLFTCTYGGQMRIAIRCLAQ